MTTPQAFSMLNTPPFHPSPRFASTVELDLSDMPSTEAQADHERELPHFLPTWIADAYLTP